MKRWMGFGIGAVAMLGLALAVTAGESESSSDAQPKAHCPFAKQSEGTHASASGCTRSSATGGCPFAAAASACLQNCADCKRADELIASWQDVPARLAAMTQEQHSTRTNCMKDAGDKNPAIAQFEPTMGLLVEGLGLAVQLDQKSLVLYAAEHSVTSGCPSKANVACSASDKTADKEAEVNMAKRMMYTAKANELILAAANGTQLAMTSAKGEQKAACQKAVKASGCCARKKGAQTAGAPGCGATKDATVASATGARESAGEVCAKSEAAKADAFVKKADALLASWDGVEKKMKAMPDAEREQAEAALVSASNACPAGKLMPATLASAQALLKDAEKLDGACGKSCDKSARDKSKDTQSAAAKACALQQARRKVVKATLALLEKWNASVKPSHEMAMAG